MEQGSAEWKQARCGMATASRMDAVLATIKNGEAAARRDYKYQLVAERLTGVPQESGFINAEMMHGTEFEPFGRSAYEVLKGVLVDQVPILYHPTIKGGAASPDGLVGADGMLEIKAPKTATHLGYLSAGVVPAKYIPQMNWQLACAGPARHWVDFVSFDPRLPEHLQLFVCRLNRDDGMIRSMEAEVSIFLSEVDALVEKLKARA